MRTTSKLVIVMCSAALAVPGCKKGSGTGGGGGGGGGWLVGTSGLMVNVRPGQPADAYPLGDTETLYQIACRYEGEAWVAGAHGTLLYTDDGGDAWISQAVPSSADLRAVATQDAGPVFVAGDGVFLTGVPEYMTGAVTWRSLGDGVASFRSVAAAQRGTTVLAVSADGGLWSYEREQLVRRGTVAGARAIAVSPDGRTALVAGDGLARSTDGGATWTKLATNPGVVFEDVRVDDQGAGLAVGGAGAVAMIDAEGRVLHQQVGTADLHTLHVGGWGDGLGYAAGDGGQVWLTRDGGWSWEVGPKVDATVLGIDEIGVGHR